MRECVVIPTYKRDALLYVCLERIRAAEPNIEIHVFPDKGTTAWWVYPEFGAFLHEVPEHEYHGNSYNMIEAIKWTHEHGYDKAFIIEDDCMVDPTFFAWARKALDQPKPWMGKPFAACGWIYSPDAPNEDGPDVLCNWYLSVCCCLPSESLALIAKHATPEYYANMQRYCDQTFPRDYNKGSQHFEQDGLILRVANDAGLRMAWPRRARGKHIGWHGYHMPHGKQPQGELMEQVAVVHLALENDDVLRSLMSGAEPPKVDHCRDCAKVLVSTYKKATLVCVGCFHKQYPSAPRVAESHYYLSA